MRAPLPDEYAIDNPVLVAMVARRNRETVQAIGALDRTLTMLGHTESSEEVIFAQLKIAWWRDELGSLCEDRHRPDPVLAALARNADDSFSSSAVALADAYEEQLLARDSGMDAVIAIVKQRGARLARLIAAGLQEKSSSSEAAGMPAALAGYGLRSENPTLHQMVRKGVADIEPDTGSPRIVRAFDGWARRISRRDPFHVRALDQAYLLRMGMIGR